jgi:acetylornithine/succinyldiaminopimelate/putrescine aminotransferase
MTRSPLLSETCEQIIRYKIPNFFRPYLNPFVVQTCYCLGEYVRTTWRVRAAGRFGYQTFLANSFDEAFSGSVKLARYCANVWRRRPAGLVIDPDGRLGPTAAITTNGGQRIEFIPGLTTVGADVEQLKALCRSDARFGFVVLLGAPGSLSPEADAALRLLIRRRSPLVVTSVNRDALAACRRGRYGLITDVPPDVVIFDESFTNFDVPFGAFTARKELFDDWNRGGKSAFHSTTFQPNTIGSLHFLRCLEATDARFYADTADELERIRQDPKHCRSLLGRLYSPFLAKAIRSLGLATDQVTATGHYIVADGRPVLDCVAGVACSIRGHNPDTYLEEIDSLADTPDLHTATTSRLKALTGLDHLLPAVSGASAVENALRLGLAAQYPKTYVLAFRGGFGGKTLLALTGTARARYKEHLDPLYPYVIYFDPFGPHVLKELDGALDRYPVAVVQLELIQAVGGVRPIPAHVVEYLQTNRSKRGYLLFVDEVQTGMYRTGPFVLSRKLGIRPDFLTIGKGTSDMMFPFALTLYTDAVRARLDACQPGMTEAIRQRYSFDWGYMTVLNVLRMTESQDQPEHAAQTSALFAELLTEGLASCRAVRAVRGHGLLLAIELDTGGWVRRRFKKAVTWLYLAALLHDQSFPVFAGFCQYRPNVLKLTPPLSLTPDEVRNACATISSVLNTPLIRLLPAAIRGLVGSTRRLAAGHQEGKVTHEPVRCEL